MNDEQMPKLRRIQELNRVFTPSAPVGSRQAFSGRWQQIMQITSAVSQPGRHVILYGERGVGKTSLANILSELLMLAEDNSQTFAVRVNCTVDDTFSEIWRRVARELRMEVPEQWRHSNANPDDIRAFLAGVTPARVVVLDEYDRLDNDDALSLIADTIKSLSDHLVTTKVVLVGVSDSIEELVGEHESIKRAIEEVRMPRMGPDEIVELVHKGFESLSMTIEAKALARVVKLSEGLPTYAHSLSLKAGTHAIQDDRTEVSFDHIERSTQDLVQEKHSSVASYFQAIQSPRPENLYAQVLAACALAEKDELGYFTANAVKVPMSKIMGKEYDIPAFSRHLSEFMRVERGATLQRRGEPRKYRYRFRDPVMQPFAIMAALSAGLIPRKYEKELFAFDADESLDALIAQIQDGAGEA